MLRLIVLFAVLSGCSSQTTGPKPEQEELGFEVAWESALGMSQQARPTVTWYDGNGCEKTTWHGVTIAVPGACQTSIVDSDGVARVAWFEGGSIATSDFAIVLSKYAWYLKSGKLTAVPDSENAVREALFAAGL